MRDLSIAFFNVRSLTSSFSDVKDFILQENFDVIGIVETWLTDGVPSTAVNIDGYKFVRCDRETRGGGVGLYLKSNLRYEVVKIGCLESLEQLWVKLTVSKKQTVVGVLYRAPNKNILDFLSNFEDTVSDIFPRCNEVICGGDINIDMLDLSNRKTLLFTECFESFNFKQVINNPTRVTNSSSTLLDIILISNDLNYEKCGVKNVPNVSDHYLVFCTLKDKKTLPEETFIKFRNFKRIDLELLNNLLRLTPFDDIIDMQNINAKVDYFNSLLIGLFDAVAPEKSIKIKKQKQPWFTDTIKLMITIRDKALKKYEKTKSKIHWEYYKTLRNQTNVAIRNEKKHYLQYVVKNNNSSKVLWKKLDNLNVYNKSKETNELPDTLNVPDDVNNYFLQQGTGNFVPDKDLVHYYNTNFKTDFNRLFTFETVPENVIYKYLLEIKSKATGADQINIEMLLLCCPHILPYVTDIVNFCLDKNVFPDAWKVSKVIPIPKCANPTSFNELRPISLLSVLSKITEKIMNYQIRNHLNNHNILPINQSGFRSGYSCTSALLKITDDILTATDQGKATALVLIDYSKAFDTISHKLLYSILHFIGFSENSILLIKNYLLNRVQFVETAKGKSNYGNIVCGVPQGSILGPLLFCIYTCNLVNVLKNCNAHMYADDTQVYHSFYPTDTHSANAKINNDLKELALISELHNLQINPTKSNVLVFGKNRGLVERNISIVINNNALSPTSEAKNLGVIFEVGLRFKKHISKCIQKAYYNLKLLYPHRHLLSKSLKIKLTDSLVLSHFNYCDVLYGPCLDKVDINRIQRAQKSCLRFIYGVKKYEKISHKLLEAEWLSMAARRQLHSLILFHNVIVNKSPPYLFDKIVFRSDVHTLNLRYKGLLSPPTHRTAIYRRSFSYTIYYLYNQLPSVYKHLSTSNFKTQVKKHLN